MLALTHNMRLLVATEHIDFRKGIDGIAALCRNEMSEDPMDGTLFVFINRSRTQVRCLLYDGQGFWLCAKRLSSGRFPYWPSGKKVKPLLAEQLFVLLRGGNPSETKTLSDWRRIS